MRRTWSAFVVVLAVLSLAACAPGSGGPTSAGPAPDDITTADMWSRLSTDLRDGRSQSVEARARALAEHLAKRCQRLRSEVARGAESSSAIDTGQLARCEEDLRQYRLLGQLGQFSHKSVLSGPTGR